MKNLTQVLKNFFKRLRASGIVKSEFRTNSSYNFFNNSFNSNTSKVFKL